MKLIFTFLATVACACAQLSGGGGGVTVGATLPGTCAVGQLFFVTTAGATFGTNQCLSLNTWSVIAGASTVAWGGITGTLALRQTSMPHWASSRGR
jgi:hypothetical protein